MTAVNEMLVCGELIIIAAMRSVVDPTPVVGRLSLAAG